MAKASPRGWVAAVVLLTAIGVTYWHALTIPFVFDDVAGVQLNGSTYSLWPLVGSTNHRGPLNPGSDLPTVGRPLVNLSFALNYAIGGDNPAGYHAFNIVIHFLVALFLWAVVRRSLCLPYFNGRFEASAGWLALATALLWALHPLQTETVVYITQRTELMMALFYLATLYCSLRYWAVAARSSEVDVSETLSNSPQVQRAIWISLAALACLAGMASKEVMVSAPIMVLLFERTFVSGSLGKSLRRSWSLYVVLACTWLLLLVLNISSPRGNSAGFGLAPPLIAWWLTQAQILLIYFKLVFWPWPLLVHYQLPLMRTFAEAWFYVIPVLLLIAATGVMLWRNRPVGFLLTWVFVILAPTSLVPILTEMGAERRMYLPLAAFVVLFVVAGYALVQKLARKKTGERPSSFRRHQASVLTASMVSAIALISGVVSVNRIFAYDDLLNLWNDVVHYQPKNYLAYISRGALLSSMGRRQEAIDDLHKAIALKPDHPVALNNLGLALKQVNLATEAVVSIQSAIEIAPDYPQALSNLATILMDSGRYPEAIEQFKHWLRLHPDDAVAHSKLADALGRAGRRSEALDEFRAALALKGDDPLLHSNLASFFIQLGQYQDAIDQCQEALRLQKDCFDAHLNLGTALLHVDRMPEAVEELRAAQLLKPDDAIVLNTVGATLLQNRQYPEAVDVLERAVKARPKYPEALNNLGLALAHVGKTTQAIEQFRLAAEADNGFAAAQLSWALLLAAKEDFPAAIPHFEKAIELGEEKPDVHNNLGDAYRKSGNPNKAIEHYQIAVRLNSSFMLAYANLAQTLAMVDRSKDALAVSEKAMEVARKTGQADELGQFEEWLKHYQAELRRAAEAASSANPPLPKQENEQAQ